MTSLWDLSDEKRKYVESAGVDYSLSSCLEYNPQTFDILDIEKVLAVWEGENDGDDWRWVIKLNKDAENRLGSRFVFLQGGCDYTGWDCQSWATSKFASTALKAAKFSDGQNVELNGSSPMQAGLGHLLNMLSGEYMNNVVSVYDTLVSQIKTKKSKTWRENKDEELGTESIPKI